MDVHVFSDMYKCFFFEQYPNLLCKRLIYIKEKIQSMFDASFAKRAET